MKIILPALAALSLLTLAACETGPGYGPPPPPGYGQPGPAPIFERIQNLRERIRVGEANGSLAPGEARRVVSELNDIEAQANRMRSDGRMSPNDRRILDDRLNHLNETVRWLKHN